MNHQTSTDAGPAVVTQTQAARVAARTAEVVARMRAEADAAEARGDLLGAESLRRTADSRERAGARVRPGARIARDTSAVAA
ncbi:hypothetical protein [Cellulomonas sp.]|uniref:hypothetical protein n=1 Tax=Cellulomonas sp. TaxID=40001 RepID=UPI001B1A3A33|nr:hypothetical protein [Cellulomonas sp.]MBO9555571.1 hypothetical protein [Cellulomonas sp.]